MPAARAIATRWMRVVGRAAGRVQADDAVDDRALVDHLADRRVVVAERGDRGARFAAALVSASRKRRVGLTKRAPGRCRPITSISIWLELAVP